MPKIKIEGGHNLTGTISVGGAKNSVVGLLPAAILSKGKCKIYNVPNISDVKKLNEMLSILGAEVTYENDEILIDNTNLKNTEITKEYSSTVRASYYFMGALLGRYHKAEISYPGGCVIGSRPIDFHISAFEKMGAKVEIDDNKYVITAEE